MLKKIILIAVALVLVLCAWMWFGFANRALPNTGPDQSVVLEKGGGISTVTANLDANKQLIGNSLQWRLLGMTTGAAGNLKVGEYDLPKGITPRQLLINMRDGKVVVHKITLVEGKTFKDFRRVLASNKVLKQETASLDDAAIMTKLGAAGVHPEGRFLPDTYVFHRGDSDLDVMKHAYGAMTKALDAAWAAKSTDVNLKSKDEMLTLASIVEKETGTPEERPEIAGLFLGRLKTGMLLQTDPTIIYGMGDAYQGNIRKSDLTADGPYNTYTRAGLPPTPIAMPGKAALDAVAKPDSTENVYFVAIGDGSGKHYFAKTYAEHQANVAKYIVTQRETNARNPAKAAEKSQ